jgi:hypothetical protein
MTERDDSVPLVRVEAQRQQVEQDQQQQQQGGGEMFSLKSQPKKDDDGPRASQPQNWSSARTLAFWIGVILLVGVLAGLAYIGIRSLTEVHELESGQRDLTTEIEILTGMTGDNVTVLQALANQTSLPVGPNGTLLAGPGVAVGLTTPGPALIYRLVPDPNPTYNDVAWDFALWDDANYWSLASPGLVFPPATGRYAVGLNCPTCCELDGSTTVEGTVNIVYSTTTEPSLHCPRVIAVETVRATNPTSTVPSVSLYAEFELTAGTGEFLAVEPVLDYTFRKRGFPGGNDQCTFTVRYLSEARGTPMVPQVCVKRSDTGKKEENGPIPR